MVKIIILLKPAIRSIILDNHIAKLQCAIIYHMVYFAIVKRKKRIDAILRDYNHTIGKVILNIRAILFGLKACRVAMAKCPRLTRVIRIKAIDTMRDGWRSIICRLDIRVEIKAIILIDI